MSEKINIRCTNQKCIELIEKHGEQYHRVYDVDGKIRCIYCGGVMNIKGEFIYICVECKKKTDKLYGLFVPHLCKECIDKKREIAIEKNDRCLMCCQLRMDCCC